MDWNPNPHIFCAFLSADYLFFSPKIGNRTLSQTRKMYLQMRTSSTGMGITKKSEMNINR